MPRPIRALTRLAPCLLGAAFACAGCTRELGGSTPPSGSAGANGPAVGGSSGGAGMLAGGIGGGGGLPTDPVTNRPTYPEVDNGRIFDCQPGDHGATAARIWRLTATQYLNTVATFLDPSGLKDFDQSDLEDADEYFPHLWAEVPSIFDSAASPDRFTTYSDGVSMGIEDLQDALSSTALAANAAVDYNNESCVAAADLSGCLSQALRERGEVLFRRPLSDEEVAKYTKIATDNVATLGTEQAIGAAYQAMLLSPRALFRVEAGAGDPDANGRYTLTPHEVAAALSYTFVDGPPDPALRAAAESGGLATADGIQAQIVRLIGDGTRRSPMLRFFRQYFHYDRAAQVFKDTTKHPEANPSYFIEDTDAMVRDSLAKHGNAGLFSNVLTRTDGFYNQWYSAAVYGYESTYDNTRYPTTYPAGTRFGILSQPSWLSAFSKMEETEPVQRGRFVNESLLCRKIPDLPIGLIPKLPDLGPSSTMRDRLLLHKQPDCAGCHDLMDPIGFGFEQWDHVGNYRTTEGGKPVDSSGSLSGTGDQDGPFATASELMTRLASSKTVHQCMVRHNFRYYLGRPELEADACSMKAAWDAYSAGQEDYFAMLSAFFTSDSFLKRTRQ